MLCSIQIVHCVFHVVERPIRVRVQLYTHKIYDTENDTVQVMQKSVDILQPSKPTQSRAIDRFDCF